MSADILTTHQVMKKYRKTYTQVRYATEVGRLKAEKVGWVWVYPIKDLPETWPSEDRRKSGGTS